MMIGYFYSNYFNLYYNINDNLKKIIQKNHFKLKKLIVKSENKEKCKECKKETEQLIFLEKKFIICEKCLRAHINEILKYRTRNFEKEEFNGLEYYNGPIHLKDEYYIDNYDMIELYGENMKNKLYENESYNCVSCDRLINDQQYNLKCGCKYCKKCFIKQLKIITQNNMFLNRYERETYEKKNVFVVKFLTLMKCYNYIHQMKKN
jgi:late competence protein required for DNA uptake (superfamily II DNA/RNA helicase)